MWPFAFNLQNRPLAASALHDFSYLVKPECRGYLLSLDDCCLRQERVVCRWVPNACHVSSPANCSYRNKDKTASPRWAACKLEGAGEASHESPVIIGIIKRCSNHHDPSVTSIDKLHALEGVRRVLLWVCQVESWLLEPLLLCSKSDW